MGTTKLIKKPTTLGFPGFPGFPASQVTDSHNPYCVGGLLFLCETGAVEVEDFHGGVQRTLGLIGGAFFADQWWLKFLRNNMRFFLETTNFDLQTRFF